MRYVVFVFWCVTSLLTKERTDTALDQSQKAETPTWAQMPTYNIFYFTEAKCSKYTFSFNKNLSKIIKVIY